MKFDKYFEDNKDKQIDVYVDMDGVLAEYDIGNFDYETIRPITTIINKLEELNKNNNISIYVLSICKTDNIISQKYKWFAKHADFINKENLIFISKEDIILSSKEIKLNYLKNSIDTSKLNVLIDDDNQILSFIKKDGLEIKLFQDSSLII